VLHHPTARRGLRLLLGLAVTGSLLAACGDDDDASNAGDDTEADGGDATTTTGDDGDSGGGEGLANRVCEELTAAEVSEATGLELDDVEGDAGSCTYQSDGGAFIALVVTDVAGVSGDLVMQGARSGCSGDPSDIDVDGADEAFTCEASSVTIVGAVGNGILAVASGADLSGSGADLVEALTGLMELAISEA